MRCSGLMSLSLIGASCFEVGVLDASILKTERPVRYLISLVPDPSTIIILRAALSRLNGFVRWHERELGGRSGDLLFVGMNRTWLAHALKGS